MASKKTSLSKRKMTFSFDQVALFAAAFVVLGILALSQTFAARGGGAGGKVKNDPNGLSFSMIVDQNSDGLPNWNDTIKPQVTTTLTTEPHVELSCTQNGSVVYSATTGLYASYPWPWTQNMQLSSNAWTGGAADCTGNWYYFSGTKKVNGGTLLFHVNA